MTKGYVKGRWRNKLGPGTAGVVDAATLKRLDAAIKAYVTLEDLQERFVRVGVPGTFIAKRRMALLGG